MVPARTVKCLSLEIRRPFNFGNIRPVQGADGAHDDGRRAHKRLAGEIVLERTDPLLSTGVPNEGLAGGIKAATPQNIIPFGNGEEVCDSECKERIVSLISRWTAEVCRRDKMMWQNPQECSSLRSGYMLDQFGFRAKLYEYKWLGISQAQAG